MSSSQALNAIKQDQSRSLRDEYAGKMSNQFIAELKGAALFQFDKTELLSTAPTAMSFAAACWIAAAQPKADQPSLEKFVPAGGMKYLTNRHSPTLRSCLVDVCNGGQDAFRKASSNISELQIRSQRICQERIELVTRRLAQCDRGSEALEDFNDSLQDFAREASQCATLARDTRETSAKWGLNAGELHTMVEQQEGVTSSEGFKMVDVEQKLAAQSFDIKSQMAQITGGLKSADKCIDQILTNVPSSWESTIQGTASGFALVIPGIVSGALPTVIAGPDSVPAAAAHLTDSAYSTAVSVCDLANHFYEYLGGEKGTIDRSKFDSAGLTYLSTVLTSVKSTLSNNEIGRQLQEALDRIIAVVTKMQGQADLPEAEVQQWKDGIKAGRETILALATTANGFASNAVPVAFVKVAPAQSISAAAVQTVLQGGRMAQTSVEGAQSNYDSAIERQLQTAATMEAINSKLAKYHADGQITENIRSILQNGISVLIDLTTQLGKLERLFGMLAALVDCLVERAEIFTRYMGRGNQSTVANGAIKIVDVTKQSIYGLLLQLKAYFSLLEDVSSMYCHTDRSYLVSGNDLCMRVSSLVASNQPLEGQRDQLVRYTQDSAKAIAELAKQKQEETLNALKDRARRAAETTEMVENTAKGHGLEVDASARQAIEAGGEAARKVAKEIIAAKAFETKLT